MPSFIEPFDRPAALLRGSPATPQRVIRGRTVVVTLAVLAVLAALMLGLAAGAAATSNTSIGFDELSAGSILTTQYAADGITFGRASDYGLNLGNPDCGPPQVVSDGADARSAPNVAGAPRCSSSDSSSVGTFAAFSFARKSVSAYVGTALGVSGVRAMCCRRLPRGRVAPTSGQSTGAGWPTARARLRS